MKKTKFFSLLMLGMLLLVSCSSGFPKVASYYTSPFELTDKEKFWREDLTLGLSPDGSSIVVGGRYLANLVTGEREDLYKRFKVGGDTTIKNHDILDGNTYWSFDGHYLGMLAQHYESGRDPVGYATYIFDLRDNTFRRYDIRATSFSPFNSYQVFTDKGVYNLNDGMVIPLLPDYDFTQEKEFGVTKHGLLWSKRLGVPVAEFGSLPHPDDADIEMGLHSYNPMDPVHPKYSIPIGFIVKPNQARILLDATGEYILAIEWQCPESESRCSKDPAFPNNVHDTVLTLVRWRTKEQKELIRLSEIDPENVVADGDGYMAWSADGSTIFISRKDALPVVLKVK